MARETSLIDNPPIGGIGQQILDLPRFQTDEFRHIGMADRGAFGKAFGHMLNRIEPPDIAEAL